MSAERSWTEQPVVPAGKTPRRLRGYRGFDSELELRFESAVRAEHANPKSGPGPRSRLLTAARILEQEGMPARHAAARQLLVGYLGVFDRFFGPPADGCLEPTTDFLCWRCPGGLVIDVPRAVGGQRVLLDADTHAKLAAAHRFAAQRGDVLLGTRVLALAAPATSLWVGGDGDVEPLAGCGFVTGLLADATAQS
jgi:hypothetical protein